MRVFHGGVEADEIGDRIWVDYFGSDTLYKWPQPWIQIEVEKLLWPFTGE